MDSHYLQYDGILNLNSEDEEEEQQQKKTIHNNNKILEQQYEMLEKLDWAVAPQYILAETLNSKIIVCSREPEYGQECIVKIVKEGSKQIVWFQQEIIRKHSHIVKPIAIHENVILFPRYEGNLMDYISKASPYPIDVEIIIKMCVQISDALVCLHSQGIVHGDINPYNVLYSTQPQLTFYLSDFSNSFYQCSQTATQMTPYRAPEPQYSFQSDIWGLGCIIFECMTSTFFLPQEIEEGEEFSGAIEEIFETSYIPNSIKRFSLKKHQQIFKQILIEKLLEKNPSKRASAFELHKWAIRQMNPSR